MTVSTSANRADYLGNNVTTAFAVPFYFPDSTNLQVLSTVIATGVSTTLVLNSDYTVAGAGVSTGGTVTTTVAPASTVKLSILLNLSYTQQFHYVPNDPFPAASHEAALDYVTLLAKQTAEVASRSLQVPSGESGTTVVLPTAPSRANTVLAFDSAGNPIASIPASGTAADVLIQLADTTVANKGSGLPGFNQALNYVARTIGASLVDRGVDLMNYVTSQTERAAIKAGTSVSDHSAFFTAAFILAKKVFVPAGAWRLLSFVTLPSGCILEGAGVGATSIGAYGVDAFRIAAGSSFIHIHKFGLFSYTAGGSADPRLYDAILCNGVSGNLVNYVTTRDLYIQGFADSVNWKYTWNSRVDNVTTINTNFGLQVTGLSVNNSVTGCRFVANSGTASIQTSQSGADTPEGLMVTDSLLSSGNYGILGLGSFLSLQVTNCVIDLIAIDAIHTTDCKDLRVTNNWMYAASGCVRLMALGGATSEGASITGNVLRLTGAANRVIEQQGANIGLTVTGNHLVFSGTSAGVYLDGQAAIVEGNYFDNAGSGADVILNSSASTHRVGKNTKSTGAAIAVTGGFSTPEYVEANWTVTDQSGASLAIAATNQATYTKVGKLVTCVLDITYPATANASVARLSLPFQPDAGSAVGGSIALQQTVTVSLQPNAGTAAANFVFWKPATQAFATNADLTGAHLIVSFTYRAIS